MGREGKGMKGRGIEGGEGREERGREGTPNILLHPQFQFSRNMPAHSYWKQGALGAAGQAKTCMGWSWAAACGVQGRGHIVAVARLQLVLSFFC